MKELLKKHYGLEIEYSRNYQDGLIFFVNGDYYYLCKCLLNEEELLKCYDLYLLLKSKSNKKLCACLRNKSTSAA